MSVRRRSDLCSLYSVILDVRMACFSSRLKILSSVRKAEAMDWRLPSSVANYGINQGVLHRSRG
jgi:hypothetical protein